MSRRVFLHVGLPKSGTSYLQKLLSANRERLAEQARLLFPGRTWSDQVMAVRDVRRLYEGRRARLEGRWQQLVDEVLAWRGDAVISMEWLCAADDREIRRILDSFADEHEVHVVFTARDLARTVPAAWQEFMQNRQTWTWDEFLAGVEDPDSPSAGGQAFWSQQHLPRLLERWGRHVPADRLHLVTLPHPGADRDLLWQRFADVVGIDPGGYTTSGLGGNESLGLESAELMRRVNLRLQAAGVPRRAHHQWFKHRLAKDVLASRRSEESSLALPDHARDWTERLAEQHIAQVAALGVHLVGDLDELRPAYAEGGRHPDEVTDAELLDTAVAAIVGLGTTRPETPVQQRGPTVAAAPGGRTRTAAVRRRLGTMRRRLRRS